MSRGDGSRTLPLTWPQSSEAGPSRSGCLATSSVQLGPRAACQKPVPEPRAAQSEVPEGSGAPGADPPLRVPLGTRPPFLVQRAGRTGRWLSRHRLGTDLSVLWRPCF